MTQNLHQKGTRQTNGTQPIPQTREMQLQTTIYRILRCTYNPGRSTNGQYQGRESTQLEDPDECHRSSEIPGVHRLLLLFYQGLLKDHPTTTPINTPNDTLVLANEEQTAFKTLCKAMIDKPVL